MPVVVAVCVARIAIGGPAGGQPVRDVLEKLFHRAKKKKKKKNVYLKIRSCYKRKKIVMVKDAAIIK